MGSFEGVTIAWPGPFCARRGSEFQEFLTFTPNTEKKVEPPLQEYEVVLEAMKRCPNVDRPVRRRRPVHKEDKLFGLHM